MKMPLRAIVVGAGWAGEGHTRALKRCGVEVVAICSRDIERTREVARRLGAMKASDDWTTTLQEERPDIVSIATPASLRLAVISAAAALGANIICEKPLASSVSEALAARDVVHAYKIKSVLATTHAYDPGVSWLRELIESGLIGNVRDVSLTYRANYPSILPWSWLGSVRMGGGILHNVMPHFLSILKLVLGGELIDAYGHSRRTIERAPMIPGLRNTKEWRAKIRGMSDLDLEQYEWVEWDSEMAASAILVYRSGKNDIPVTVRLGPGNKFYNETNGIIFYGEKGTLRASGDFAFEVSLFRRGDSEPRTMAVPERLSIVDSNESDDTDNKWCAFVADAVRYFVSDTEDFALDFQQGLIQQIAIEAIREGFSAANALSRFSR